MHDFRALKKRIELKQQRVDKKRCNNNNNNNNNNNERMFNSVVKKALSKSQIMYK
jgi:hypothetical protein